MADSSATTNVVQVANIRDSVVVLKNGTLRMILEVSAINFELRSEEEQTAILQNFQRFINSVDFPVQISVVSRKYDINEYLAATQTLADQLQSDLLKLQAGEYMKFVKELADLANIMSKKFYLAIPFFVVEQSSTTGLLGGLRGLFRFRQQPTAISDENINTYKTQLLQRAELVFDGLIGLGLKTRILAGDELANVLYGLYNPGSQSKITLPTP